MSDKTERAATTIERLDHLEANPTHINAPYELPAIVRLARSALRTPAPEWQVMVEVGEFIASSPHGIGVKWGDLGPLGSGDKLYALPPQQEPQP